jgi:hypothetical protein
MRTRILAVLAGGLLAVLVLVATAFAPQVQAAHLAKPLKEPMGSVLAIQPFTDTFTCLVDITTTSSVPSSYSFPGAIVAGYSGLALIPQTNVTPTNHVLVRTVDNWFRLLSASANYSYTFETVPDLGTNYNIGMEIYGAPPGAATLLAQDIDATNNTSAKISIIFPGGGPYFIRVFQASEQCAGGTYTLRPSFLPPTAVPSLTPKPTNTIGPTPTPYAGAPNADRFEPNNNFDQATTIGLNTKYDNLNFVQWDAGSDEWDNDFLKVRVKPGMLVTCRTLELKPGTDTNLILYDASQNGINGSDDVNRAAGDLSSSVTYYVTYEGWLYALVGEGFSRSAAEQAATGYSFECTIVNQSTPTPAPTPTDSPNMPTRTPVPTDTPIPSPTLTPTPPFIKVNPLPTATPPGLPAQQVPVSLLTYYDANGNNKYDPGEGIVGISARVIDLTTGKLLAQGLTDTTGRVSFTVSAPGAVQLVVPYLNRSEIILPSGKAVTIRVSPSELPRTIP